MYFTTYEGSKEAARKLIEINQWGNNKFKKTRAMFYSAENVIGTYTDNPDTSEVTDMANMFHSAYKFNSPINFDTSNVTDMSHMFYHARSFNQPLNFNTSKVTDMQYMFSNAKKFNQSLNFDTRNVTKMNSMFYETDEFNGSISSFNTSNVTEMTYIFGYAKAFNQPVNHFNTSKITDMSGLFFEAKSFNQPVDRLDTSKVTNMSNMFYYARKFNHPVNTFDTRNVTEMRSMFAVALEFNQPITNFNTSKVTSFDDMFYNALKFNQSVNHFDTRNGKNFAAMFAFASSFNQSISNFDTSKAERLDRMFEGASSFNQPVSNLDTRNITSLENIFSDATIFNQPIDNFETSKVTNMSGMFKNAKAFNQSVNHLKTNLVTTMEAMFYGATSFDQPVDQWNTSNLVNVNSMFYEASSFNQPINFEFSKVDHAHSMFAYAKKFNQDISHLNYTFPSKATNPIYAFVSESGLSTKNYDKLLTAWSEKLPSFNGSFPREIRSNQLRYCKAEEARNKILQKNWRINSDYKDCREYNLPPQDINLNNDNINENVNPGTKIADITVQTSSEDLPNEGLHIIELCHVAEQDDSDKFEVKQYQTLHIKTSPNYEEKNEYHLCLKARDHYGATLEKNFTIRINDINEKPAVANQHFQVDENSPAGTLVGTVSATDPDQGQTHTFSIVGGNEQGIFEISNDGKITVKDGSKLNYESYFSATLTIRATDNGTPALSSEGQIIITTKNVDETPYFTSTPVTSASRREQYYYYFTAQDPENQTLTYTVTEKPDWLNQSDQQLSGTPGDTDVEKNFTVRIKASDGTFETEQTFTIHVNDRNLEPEIQSQEFTIDENSPNGTFIGQIIATDPNTGQTLIYTAFSGDTETFQVSSDGKLSVKNNAALDYERYEDHKIIFVVKVTDNGTPNLSSNNHITIQLRDVPEAPTANDEHLYAYENTENGRTVAKLDIANPGSEQNPKFTLLSGNDLGIFELTEDGVVKIKDNTKLDYESLTDRTIVLRARATNRAVSTLYTDFNIFIEIQDENEPPYFTSTPITSATKNILYSYQITAEDPDEWDDATIEVFEKPDWLTFDNSTNTLSGTPGEAEVRQSYHIVVHAGYRTDAYQEFDIHVNDENHAPNLTNQTFNIDENSINDTILGTISATEQDQGQTLAFTLLSGNDLGIFELNSKGTLKVKDNTKLNYEKITDHKIELRVKVIDNGTPALSAEAIITVNIRDINEVPILKTTPANTAKVQKLYSYKVEIEDEDAADTPIFTTLVKPDWLSLDQSANIFSGTPQNTDANTNAELKILISDGVNQFEKTFNIHVEPETGINPSPNPGTPGNEGGSQNQNENQNQGENQSQNEHNNQTNSYVNNSQINQTPQDTQRSNTSSENTSRKTNEKINNSSINDSSINKENSENHPNAHNNLIIKDENNTKNKDPEKAQEKASVKNKSSIEVIGKFIGDWWWIIIAIIGLFIAKYLRNEQTKQRRRRSK